MKDFDRECTNCGKYLDLDDEYLIAVNDYGFPMPICEDCKYICELEGMNVVCKDYVN